MKRHAFVQNNRKSIPLSILIALILALSFTISCDVGYDIDWNKCYIDASVLTGKYSVKDDCANPGVTSRYTITIAGSCETYTISNLLSPDSVNAPLVSLRYTPYLSPTLYIYEHVYQGWTIQGTGSILNDVLNLDLNLKKEDQDITCKLTGTKN